MSFKTENYRDLEKYRKARHRQNKRYYAKTAIYKRKKWTEYEDALVLAHEMTDMELSLKLERSMGAIQARRYQLKKLNNS